MANTASSNVPLTNPISNSAFGIITARKASAFAKSNVSKLYNSGKNGVATYETRNEILEFEPVYTMHKSQAIDEDEPKELPILSALNGLPARTSKQVMRIIRFAGFSRIESANEHMRGNSNGAYSLIVHGVLTVVNTGVETISSGAKVCIRALTEEEAERQVIAGRIPGKVLLATVEYKPELDAIDKKNGFTALMIMLGVPVAKRLREITEDQAEAFSKWWKAQRTLIAVSTATMFEDQEDPVETYKKAASALGLVPGDQGNVEMQKKILQRLFVMNVFNGGVVATDINQLLVPMQMSGQTQNNIAAELSRIQATCITDQFNAIIGGHAAVSDSIIGRTPTGGIPGGDMDLVFWKT